MITFTFKDARDADLVMTALNGVAIELGDASRSLPERSAAVSMITKTRAKLWDVISNLEGQMNAQHADQDEDGEDEAGEEVEE